MDRELNRYNVNMAVLSKIRLADAGEAAICVSVCEWTTGHTQFHNEILGTLDLQKSYIHPVRFTVEMCFMAFFYIQGTSSSSSLIMPVGLLLPLDNKEDEEPEKVEEEIKPPTNITEFLAAEGLVIY